VIEHGAERRIVEQSPVPIVVLFAEMLSLPNDGRYPALELTPQQRRHKRLAALNAQLEALSNTSPVLMIFEDVHWIDPTSLEVLAQSIDRIGALAVLLVATHRPEFEPHWIGLSHVTAVTVNRLDQRQIAALVDRVAGNKALSAKLRHDIIERTDGIPLFVEEMTKAILEVEGEDAAERTVAIAPSARQSVPATLHASLMARLDRLGPAKEVAQIGAAIGREFSDELIAAMARKREPELKAASPEATEQLAAFVRMGQPPDDVAEKVMRGIMENELFIFTHPEFRNLIEDRFQRILAANPSPPAS
jgi:predicted ATPase